jgi:hypothetical protein
MQRENLIRSFPLDSINKPGGTEIFYSLIFDESGNMAVEEFYDFDQPHKSGRAMFIAPEDFDKYEVNRVPLRNLVVNKLKEILPISN